MAEKDLLNKLVSEFSRLPSIGKKTAQRLAYFIMSEPEEKALGLANSIIEAKKELSFCEKCFNYTHQKYCPYCLSKSRNGEVVCVTETPKEIEVIESTHEFSGKYHVLHGVIAPLKGVTPEDLKIKELIARIEADNIKEVIIALDFSVEADATTIYLSRLLKPLGIKVSRIASGIPAGASLEFADTVTLGQAIRGRINI
ncbi:MAG: recombination mediator RecR [Candidatus Muiribacteriota bacterium]